MLDIEVQKELFWERHQDDSLATYLVHNKYTHSPLAGPFIRESII